MNIETAAQRIAKTAKIEKRSASVVARAIFSSLDLTADAIETLAIESLASRASTILNQGKVELDFVPSPVVIPGRQGGILFEPRGESSSTPTRLLPPPTKLSGHLRILHATTFHINGVPKAMIDFTISDLNYMHNLYTSSITGYQARREVMDYVKDRLKTLHKQRISELAEGEQSILARKWDSATKHDVQQDVAV